VIRKWERRAVLTAEYGVKAVYGWLIGVATGTAYGTEDLKIYAWIDDASDSMFSDSRVEPVKKVGERAYIVRLPRYEAFTQIAVELDTRGVRWANIAGNDEILVTAIAQHGQPIDVAPGRLLGTSDLLTEPSKTRLAIRAPVASLHTILARLRSGGAVVEHLYDY
jgi:hypothetical protein